MKKQSTNPYYHPEEAQPNRRNAQRSSPYAQEAPRSRAAGNPPPRRRRKKKKSLGKRFATLLLAIVLVCGGGYLVLNRLVTGGGASLPNLFNTPEEIRDDVVNILCAGIDYEEGREYADGMGMTDVIMYVSFDVKANRISMLQIPRDTYVGEAVPTGRTGKINAVARFGEKDPAIANLAGVLNTQFGLPVDYYVTIDMDAFKTVINAIGGIEVNIPFDITDDFGNTLHAGVQTIDGDTAEFMVRQRHNYANADLGRLEMQRYMYSALLKTFKSFPLSDVIKVLPAYIQNVQTDIGLAKMGGLAMKLREVPSENILMFKLPCEPCNYQGLSVVSVHKQATAEMLNTYFRPYSEPVPAEQLSAIELANTVPDSGTIQSMDAIDSGTAQWGKDTYTTPEAPVDSSTAP